MKCWMLASAMAVVLAAPGLAQNRLDFDRVYVMGGAGYGAGTPVEGVRSGGKISCVTCGQSAIDADIDPEADARFQAGVGYRFSENWRGQIDVTDRFNQYGAIGNGEFAFNSPAAAAGQSLGTSDIQNVSLMASAIYDVTALHNREDGLRRLTPYLGAGVGVSNTNASIQYNFQNAQQDLSREKTGAAVQALAGVGIALTDRLALDMGYRYHRDLFELDAEAFGQELRFDEYDSHDALLALRYTLGASAPAAVPAPRPVPAPAPAVTPPPPPPVVRMEVTPPPPPPVVRREVVAPPVVQHSQPAYCSNNSYVVYFDFDRSNITHSAADTIRTAADRARQCGVERVTVAGHADRSGSIRYNEGLAHRRATNVRDELVRQGLDAGVIRTTSFGERQPARETADGVREQLNRRAEIVIFVN